MDGEKLSSIYNSINFDDNTYPQIKESIDRGELVVIIGTGVSINLTKNQIPQLSWKGLILNGFTYCLTKGLINDNQMKAWQSMLDSDDLDDLLSAAEFVGRKMSAPKSDLYARWMDKCFSKIEATNNDMIEAICSISRSGVPICTLNYDTILEGVTKLPSIRMEEIKDVAAWMRGEKKAILHLHGSWEKAESCVLGIRDYEITVGNEVRDLIQRSLASFKNLLFVGCGDTFADPNFSALIKWLRLNLVSATPNHYALVKNDEVDSRNADSIWRGFVEPIGFGETNVDLPRFIVEHFSSKKKAVKKKISRALSTTENIKLIQDYKEFIIKDCGQMTIEGMRADMDLGQRRFDLEKLYVPLDVAQLPPDIPEKDPEKEQKLIRWYEENSCPKTFGAAFSKYKRIALLALPGGGKTLLLKRLAVAYAESDRRKSSNDNLPDIDLMPVLIRCREWREHMHRPILTLLKNIPEITGKPLLAGLEQALIPLFKEGKVLLLIDGLDEIHDDAIRTTFVSHLEAFLEEYNLTKLVVTSREAGFSLVAPCLSRFCERWRIAPLNEEAITALCNHWHRLMTGDSPDWLDQSKEVVDKLIHSASLLKLAENPLLLTMLLVVKHGAGRLPPDKVSLYGRAVEVLLDTWNIKGHAPLNIKEAVPQLAFVAYELMVSGKQTATEKQLLDLIEQARDTVPHIRRYAKDAPHEFLKRVELRSSLLVEAGHQLENGITVPFYQFRHLTFQEYLTAVAVVEGHYVDYQKSDTILTRLESYLISEEWKEVIPMAAVFAKKQAEPLIAALVINGSQLKEKEDVELLPKFSKTIIRESGLPSSVSRLMQCLVEEAECSPETVTNALQIIAYFSKGCNTNDDWISLSKGPYGEELFNQAVELYIAMKWPKDSWLINSCQIFAVNRKQKTYWLGEDGRLEIGSLLRSENIQDNVKGLLVCGGLLGRKKGWEDLEDFIIYLNDFERLLNSENIAVWAAAARVIGWSRRDYYEKFNPSVGILNRLCYLWFNSSIEIARDRVSFALLRLLGMPRNHWIPKLTNQEISKIKNIADKVMNSDNRDEGNYDYGASLTIAFHSCSVWSDDELVNIFSLPASSITVGENELIEMALSQLGKVSAEN